MINRTNEKPMDIENTQSPETEKNKSRETEETENTQSPETEQDQTKEKRKHTITKN